MFKLFINIFRLLMVCVYPAIIAFGLWRVYRVQKYQEAIRRNLKPIIMNTGGMLLIAAMAFFIFFHLEDWIYDFDYVGHWQRALVMRNMFFVQPLSIPSFLQHSLNYDIYFSYLIAFFELPVTIINQSYGFFCFGSFVYFYMPTFILLQILYYTYFEKHKYLPLLIGVTFFQMYLCFFDGETECFGSFFIIISFMLTIFNDFDKITWIDNLSINLFGWILIFGRRFYLYALIVIYLCYFLQYLSYYHFKPTSKKALQDFGKIFCSGLLLLLVCITIYQPFFLRVVTNNYGEAYAYNNKPGKLVSLIGTFTPLILIVTAYGLFLLISQKDKLIFNLQLILSVLFPTYLFWRVQSFELHHYYLISFAFICYFTYGFYHLIENRRKLSIVFSALLILQTASVFTTEKNIPLSSVWHRVPKQFPHKQEVLEFTHKLQEISSENVYIYMATGDGLVNYSTIVGACLPSLNTPNFITNIYDIRDGFPATLKDCMYVVVSDPILYKDPSIQQMYEVITDAITTDTIVAPLYEAIYEQDIADTHYTIYKKIGDYDSETQRYFYSEMIERYPDQEALFSNILDQ